MREHSEDRPAGTTLRLLASSDIHMHLTGWDARTGQSVTDRGYDRLASVIRAARDDAPGAVVLLDNGDSLQGTPTAETALHMDGPHPWAVQIDAMGYDAIGLGNHDFDFGIEALEAFCADTRVPVVCASLEEALPHSQPHVILTRTIRCTDGVDRDLRIGVTSVLPPQTLTWNHARLAGRITFVGGVTAASRAVAALREAGADLVVVLCHSGLADTPAHDEENFALALAATVPGVDAMILGHTHERFPDTGFGHLDGVDPDSGTLWGVPAAMPGFAAALLAQIDLRLRHDAGQWHIEGHSVRLLDLEDALPDAEAAHLAAPCIVATRERMQEVVGRTGHTFHSYFAMVQSGTTDALVAAAMRETVQTAARGTDLATLPVLSAIAPAAAGGRAGPDNFVHVTQGDIEARHLAMICPYENTIWARRLTGAQLRDYLETSALFLDPAHSGHGALVAAGAPAFNFDMIHGLHAMLDPFAPVGSRVAELTRHGQPVAPQDAFLVAMTSYRGAGGGGFPSTDGPATLTTDIPVIDALRSHLGRHPVGHEHAPSVWSFADGPQRPVVIETSPRAAACFEEIAALDPVPLGLTDAGFMRVRITL